MRFQQFSHIFRLHFKFMFPSISPHLQLLPSLKPLMCQNHPWGFESTPSKQILMLIFQPHPMNHKCHWESLQKIINCLCLVQSQKYSLWQPCLYKIYCIDNKVYKFLVKPYWKENKILVVFHKFCWWSNGMFWEDWFQFWKKFFLIRFYQTESHAREKSFGKEERINAGSFMVVLKEHIHSVLWQSPSWSVCRH